MNIPPTFRSVARGAVVAGLAVTLALIAGCSKPAPALPPVKRAVVATNAVPALDTNSSAYASEFEDLPPKIGKDPFFPTSTRREPVSAVAEAQKIKIEPVIILKGIVGSPTHRLAMINDQILEVGEDSPVAVPNGRVVVRCIEIGEDYAVVKIEGEPLPKRLTIKD